jgi:hypothetical protein
MSAFTNRSESENLYTYLTKMAYEKLKERTFNNNSINGAVYTTMVSTE